MKNLRTLFYCVIQPDGAFCTWSVARNREQSWDDFCRGLYHDYKKSEAVRKAKKEGCRCVPVRLTLAEKGKGK